MNRRALLAGVVSLPFAGAAAAQGAAPVVAWDMGAGDFTALTVGCIERNRVFRIQEVYYFHDGREPIVWRVLNDSETWSRPSP